MEAEQARQFMAEAIRLARQSVEKGGGPFGAVVVKDGEIVGKGSNAVTLRNDPTAHAEVMAIRQACLVLNSFQLEGCTIFSSCEPCPMCLGAIYWARPDALYFAANREDAAKVGFDDQLIYEELPLPLEERSLFTRSLDRDQALEVFRLWTDKEDKVEY